MPRILRFVALTALLGLAACVSEGPERPRLLLETTLGNIEVEIHTGAAPVTAENFLRLVDGGYLDGALSMARGDVGTASTEFFICIDSQPALDFGGTRNPDGQGFAVFGRVVAGMATVRAIHSAPANAPTDIAYFRGQLLEQPVVIETVRRVSR